MFRLFMKARFIVIEGNTFLGTIVPKSSINDQFVPLEILNLKQLVPLLAINDHFVPRKNQACSDFVKRNTEKRNNLFLLFKKGPFQKQEREPL